MSPKRTRDSPLAEDVRLAELHHRLKNCLATVLAIVASIDPAKSVDEFKKLVSELILAYARVQDVLIESNWHQSSLEHLLKVVLAPYNGRPDHKRLVMQSQDIYVSPQVAELICFVTNELATNSAKYGALSKPHGYVKVDWETNKARTLLTFTWQDVDGPPVEPPLREGFGTPFIKKLVKRLGGKIMISYESEGAACTIRVPL